MCCYTISNLTKLAQKMAVPGMPESMQALKTDSSKHKQTAAEEYKFLETKTK